MPSYLVKVLCYWHRNQSMYFRCGSTLSSAFQVTNDVQHGGILFSDAIQFIDKRSLLNLQTPIWGILLVVSL